MLTKTLFAMIAAGGLLIAGAPVMGQGAKPDGAKPAPTATPAKKDDKQTDKKDEKKSEKAALGETAPSFELTDTDGKTVKLSDFKDKIVVLQWFNPECPHVVKHYGKASTFNDLHKDFSGKGVVFLAVNSGAPGKQGAGKDLNAKYKKDWSMPYPIMLDEKGTVGRGLRRATTPHMYIIGKDGKLAYKGCDRQQQGPRRQGLQELRPPGPRPDHQGRDRDRARDPRYGCSVKYAN